MPNWRYDFFCLDAAFGDELVQRFGMTTRPVDWPTGSGTDVVQIVVPRSDDAWFDPAILDVTLSAIDGVASRL